MHTTTTLLALPALALLAGTGNQLQTDYSAERSLRITSEASLTMETTDFSMTVDGQPVDRGGRGGGGGETEEFTSTVHVDTVVSGDEGPFRVRRTFEELEGSLSFGGGEFSREIDRESELEGVTLEIVREDGEVHVSVYDGDEPDDQALAGHLPELFLDALLPEDEVSEGDTWEIESEGVIQALGLETRLFSAGGGNEGGGGGERGGGRRGGGGGSGPSGLLRGAEWEGTAKLVNEAIEKDGIPCVAIELEFRAEGEREDQGGGRGRGRFLFDPSSSTTTLLETTYEIELAGELYFSVRDGRPVAIDLNGSMSSERITERERDGSTMVMEMSQEGTFELSLSVESIDPAFERAVEDDE